MQVFQHILPLPARLIILAVALGSMALEYGFARLRNRDSHDLRESAASFAVALGQILIRGGEAMLIAAPFSFVYRHRLFAFEQAQPMMIVALFLATEFIYYWRHRAAHRVRWLWATHAVHHSPTRLNLTAAVRLGWTSLISGDFLFSLPLVWIGFHPLAVAGMFGLNLLYQLFIHTTFAPDLGPLEVVLNTPSHHAVHHASNTSCLDRNYGGVLIVFDRLFGTFAVKPHDEPLRFGLDRGAGSLNPVRIALGEWLSLALDVRAARGRWAKARTLFGPP